MEEITMGYPAKDNSSEAERVRAKSELIRIASVLVQCHYLPSTIVEDYPQKTYTAKRVAEMMEEAHEQSKYLAAQINRLTKHL
jgi:hypothetical protein